MIAAAMHPHDSTHQPACRSRPLPGSVRASARAALIAWAAAVALVAPSASQACGYHDPASASVGMLNWAYPDALHVRTAVWMAQASGLLAAREPAPDADPLSPTFRFQQSIRLRNTQARLEDLRGRVHAALDGQAMPAFAVVLIGPMLWARFEANDGGVTLVPHATGPAPGDVVLVSDEAVVAALAEGRTTAREARAQGLVKAYGTGENVDQVSALLDQAFGLKKH
jgi:hypothetical protein